jgi:endonuclease-8
MSGSWRIRREGRNWPRPPSRAWVVLATPAADAAQFGGSRLNLRTEAEIRRDPRLRSLGPDLLAAGFEPQDGVDALRRADQGTGLGDAFLDQRVVAGIGNVYKSEACFAARIDPWRALGDLSDDELAGVVVEAASLMRAGLETGRRPHDVYRRARRPCVRCGQPVRARGQGDANRTTYWCPGCQR